MAARNSPNVTFRLQPALFQQLSDQGCPHGLSPHERARQLVTEALQDEMRLQVLHDVTDLRADIGRLRADVADAVELLMLNLSKLTPEHEAQVRSFIEEKLRRRP